MIIDKLENISLYKEIPQSVVNFLTNLSADIKNGRYELANYDYVNIESYATKSIKEARFESHRDYIDIQLLLAGRERIYTESIKSLDIAVPYDFQRDIIFYKNSVENSDYVTLDTTNFVMLFPHEAHAPQVLVNKSYEVKKLVAKIKL